MTMRTPLVMTRTSMGVNEPLLARMPRCRTKCIINLTLNRAQNQQIEKVFKMMVVRMSAAYVTWIGSRCHTALDCTTQKAIRKLMVRRVTMAEKATRSLN